MGKGFVEKAKKGPTRDFSEATVIKPVISFYSNDMLFYNTMASNQKRRKK